MIGALARKLFGSANDRRIKSYQPRVNAINALEAEVAKLTDEQLKARTVEFRKQLEEKARFSTTSSSRLLPPCAKRPSARSASAISTCS